MSQNKVCSIILVDVNNVNSGTKLRKNIGQSRGVRRLFTRTSISIKYTPILGVLKPFDNQYIRNGGNY